jgi:hypothetical protein
MKKQKLSDFLHRNDIGRIEFVVYLIMSALAVIWLFAWLCSAFAH